MDAFAVSVTVGSTEGVAFVDVVTLIGEEIGGDVGGEESDDVVIVVVSNGGELATGVGGDEESDGGVEEVGKREEKSMLSCKSCSSFKS